MNLQAMEHLNADAPGSRLDVGGTTGRRRRRMALAGAMLLAAGVLLFHRSVSRADYGGTVAVLSLDLAQPDVLVHTSSLTQLPRDLLKVPLARDLLTEDFVFYYQDDPDRLGLEGSLRRIAYEHELLWKDDVVAWVLDQPAEMALWRGEDGRLRHWLVALSRPPLVKLLQQAATPALNDRQLSIAGQLTVAGQAVDVLALEASPTRTFLAVGAGDRAVLLSDPGMLLSEERTILPEPAARVVELLSSDPARRPFGQAAPEAGATAHSIRMRGHYLSFGYQRFFPALEALRFDFGATGWSTQVQLDPAHLPAAGLGAPDLWAGVPANPAACGLVPVDWLSGKELLEGVAHDGRRPAALADAFVGPAAVCWYPSGRLQAPLFVATLREGRADLRPLFAALFAWAIRAPEDAGPLRVRRRPSGEVVWQRELEVPYAALSSEGEPMPGPLEVTLAVKGRSVFFSPDGARVEQALATLAKRYPSLADALPTESVTLGVLSPAGLAALGKAEALAMVPRGSEPIFRGAAERLLLPRLEAISRYPTYRLALAAKTAATAAWQPVEWQEVAR